MVKKNKRKSKFIFVKKGTTQKNPTSNTKKLEIEKIINAPRSYHYKREKLAYDEFHDLEFQRLSNMDNLKKSITEKCLRTFKFHNWVRCVRYEYSNKPLSSRGSINSIGGRFNIGSDISESHFTPFNALYISEDTTTSLLETFSVSKEENLEHALDACFAKKESFSTVYVKGILHNVLDLDLKNALNTFIEVLNKINYSQDIQDRRKAEGLAHGHTIKTIKELKEALYNTDWRLGPQLYDLPSTPQTFGQIAYRAGIEAILYTSVKDGKKCLAIFPKNLSEKSSIELEGAIPNTVEVSILNVNSFEKCL